MTGSWLLSPTALWIGGAVWIACAFGAGFILGRATHLADEMEQPEIGCPCDDCDDYLADVPADCVGQDEIDARFRQIVSGVSTFEGWA